MNVVLQGVVLSSNLYIFKVIYKTSENFLYISIKYVHLNDYITFFRIGQLEKNNKSGEFMEK